MFYSVFSENVSIQPFSALQCLNDGDRDTETIMNAVTLTPSGTLAMYQSLRAAYPHHAPFATELGVTQYAPFSADAESSSSKLFISRNDVQAFQEDLKTEFLTNCYPNGGYPQILENLNADRPQMIDMSRTNNEDFPALVEYMMSHDMLPCLVFSMDRSNCESLIQRLLDYFEAKEARLRQTVYREKIAMLEKKRHHESLDQKKDRDKKQKGKEEEDALRGESANIYNNNAKLA